MWATLCILNKSTPCSSMILNKRGDACRQADSSRRFAMLRTRVNARVISLCFSCRYHRIDPYRPPRNCHTRLFNTCVIPRVFSADASKQPCVNWRVTRIAQTLVRKYPDRRVAPARSHELLSDYITGNNKAAICKYLSKALSAFHQYNITCYH